MKKIGVMLDCSRGGVYTVAALKKYIGFLSEMGYGSLQLYTEDVYEIPEEPYSAICAADIHARSSKSWIVMRQSAALS